MVTGFFLFVAEIYTVLAEKKPERILFLHGLNERRSY
jgi:hypothetical protein